MVGGGVRKTAEDPGKVPNGVHLRKRAVRKVAKKFGKAEKTGQNPAHGLKIAAKAAGRVALCAAMLLLLFTAVALTASARGEEGIAASLAGNGGEAEAPATAEAVGDAALDDFREALPPEVAELLPSEFFSGDKLAAGEALHEAAGVEAIFSRVRDALGGALRRAVSLFAAVLSVLLVGALLRSFGGTLGGETAPAYSFLSTLVLILLIARRALTEIPRLSAYFETVHAVSASLLPAMGTLYALGGNIRAAVSNHAIFSVFLSVSEMFCSRAVLPVSGACLSLALSDAVSGRYALKSLTALIRRTFSLGLSFLMLLLSFLLGLQTTLAAGADTLALRTARFAAGSFLPIVGGSVASALGTVSGSITYLRTLVGGGGILVLFLLFLPIFLSVLITRTAFSLSAAAADLLGDKPNGRLLSELSGVYGYFLAVIAVLFVMAVFSLTLFARCAVA